MSDAAEYRAYGDKMLELALRTEDVLDRGHMISLAAHWHMKAVRLERGLPPEPDYMDGFEMIPAEPGSPQEPEPEH